MKQLAILTVVIAAFWVAIALSANVQEPLPAPDFELQDIRQDIVMLGSYRDKQAVVLLFWKSAFPLCQKEISVLNNLYASLVSDEIEVLSVNVGERPDTVESFILSYNLAYRVLLDKDTRVAKSFGVIAFPAYVLVNKQGEVVFRDDYFPYEYKDLLFKEELPKDGN